MLCALHIVLGGSRSGLSRVFRFMLTMVNQRYGKLVSNVKIWSEYFQTFSQHFRGMGFPFDNGVLFVDDTLFSSSSCVVSLSSCSCVSEDDLL